MGEKYIVALDQGTTSSRAVLVDHAGRMVDCVHVPADLPQAGLGGA